MRTIVLLIALLALTPTALALRTGPTSCQVDVWTWHGSASCDSVVDGGAQWDVCPDLDAIACADVQILSCHVRAEPRPITCLRR